jgi:hypothetical protein
MKSIAIVIWDDSYDRAQSQIVAVDQRLDWSNPPY